MEIMYMYIYIYNKKEFVFLQVSEHFPQNRKSRMYFGIAGLFCTINCYFEYRNRILCIFLYMGTYFKDIFEHFSTPKSIFLDPQIDNFPTSVTNFRIEDLLGFLVLTGPLNKYRLD